MKKILCVIALVGFFYGCKKQSGEHIENSSECSGPAKSFANDVNAIIQASCSNRSGCHGNGSTNGPGPLLNYSQIFNARSDIRSDVASGRMPLNATLTTFQKNIILCWIDNGALNN